MDSSLSPIHEAISAVSKSKIKYLSIPKGRRAEVKMHMRNSGFYNVKTLGEQVFLLMGEGGVLIRTTNIG